MSFTQNRRLISIETPLGKDVLLLASFRGAEGLSRLYTFELEMLSENHSIPFADIIGKNVTISVMLADGGRRYFNGIISRFSQGRGGGAHPLARTEVEGRGNLLEPCRVLGLLAEAETAHRQT